MYIYRMSQTQNVASFLLWTKFLSSCRTTTRCRLGTNSGLTFYMVLVGLLVCVTSAIFTFLAAMIPNEKAEEDGQRPNNTWNKPKACFYYPIPRAIEVLQGIKISSKIRFIGIWIWDTLNFNPLQHSMLLMCFFLPCSRTKYSFNLADIFKGILSGRSYFAKLLSDFTIRYFSLQYLEITWLA